MTLWVVRCGRDLGIDQAAFEQKFVGIGWGKLGDISKYENQDDFRKYYLQKYPEEKSRTQIASSSQVFTFLRKIQIGDLVALPMRSRGAIAFGKIVGDYRYVPDAPGYVKHQRKVEWIGQPIPRSSISQDLLFMFGAFLTVFQVSRNDAENRVLAILSGKKSEITTPLLPADDQVDIASVADDQIRKLIAQKFAGHKLAELVGEILRARGYAVKISPEGPDGGVDILAGSGKLGFEAPRIAVQVKSGSVLVDSPTVHQLQGAMKNFDATNGLIVSWGGFNSSALKEEKKLFFTVKMWNSDDLISNLIDVYEKLPEAVKTEIPMKKIWALMPEEE